MTSNRAATSAFTSSAFSSWINRGMEALWLLTIVLVPLVFIDRDHIFSEAIIAFVEVPKIALLRTLSGLMAVLWLLEWGMSGSFPLATWLRNKDVRTKPAAYISHLRAWLGGQPTRWVVLAVWFFLITTLVSTLLSTAFQVSLWGEVPGQDGLSTYTMASYLLLFGVIATHLKTRPQLWRLLSAVVLVGVLLSGLATLQHYGHDVLGTLEATGGGQARVTSTVGNAVFAGAAMLIPISISFVLATLTLQNIGANSESKERRRSAMTNLIALGFWTLVLTVQFLGIIFTFSRGPWLGTLFALLAFLVLALLAVGWRAFAWAGLILGLAGSLTWAILQGSGTGTASGIGPWVGVPLVLAGLGTLVVVFRDSSFSNAAMAKIQAPFSRIGLAGSVKTRLIGVLLAGAVATSGLVLGIFMALPSSDNGPRETEVEGQAPENLPASTISNVTERFTSVSGEVLSGGISNRVGIWSGSLVLMRDRPWFGFEDLSLAWLRPLVGYGPDMFRYTYQLVSVPLDASFLPAEPDHAHNFFLNQGVEQGILGLLSSVGIYLSVFAVGAYQLFRKSGVYSPVHKLVLVGLLATMAGRLLEQTVGVTRVSDLMLFWVVLALFAALPAAMQSSAEVSPASNPSPTPPRGHSRNQKRQQLENLDLQTLVRLVIVAWAIGGVMALTWVKAVNYPRAAVAAGESIEQFNRGDYQAALTTLDRASRLAPDVPVYHGSKAAVYRGYLINPQVPLNPKCALELGGVSYQDCLVQNIYLNNVIGSEQRPYYWRTRLSWADSALALGLEDEAIRLYRETVALVPAGWLLHNRLAEAYIDIGQPEAALEVLEVSIGITKDSHFTSQAHNLQALAHNRIEAEGGSVPEAQEY